MFPRRVALPLLAAVAAVAALPAASPAATGPYPTIRSVAPKKLAVGERLTLRGRNYRKGKQRNTVVFKRDGSRAVFVRATGASTTRISLVVPAKLLPFFRRKADVLQPTRFRLRVLAARFGKRFTPDKLTPLIAPARGGSDGPAVVPSDCDRDGVPDSAETDDDNDLLPDTLEKAIGTDSCRADTDGDGVSDGFEYASAKDLNDAAVPYPGKRPYPNALDKDAEKDFDGDGLTLGEEYAAWVASGRPQPYNYSDGTQWSVGNAGQLAYRDDNRDADQDGLSNGDEAAAGLAGPMHPEWWAKAYDGQNGPKETAYFGPGYAGTSLADPDTDGDGVLDGVDDQDHDGYPNWFEVRRPANWQCTYVSTRWALGDPGTGTGPCAGLVHDNPLARVQPFNPCKPVHSRACHAVFPFGYYEAGEDWDSPYGPDAPPPAPADISPPSGPAPTLIR